MELPRELKEFMDIVNDEAKYYQSMVDDIMLNGTAEEKRIAAICPEQLRKINKYGSYTCFHFDDAPNLNRLRRFIQEIIDQKLEKKYEQNLQFIEQHGVEFTESLMHKLDLSGLYWKEFPDDDYLPYLYEDCLQFCLIRYPKLLSQ